MILNPEHQALVKAAWESIGYPPAEPQAFAGELDSLGAMDYFWYEGFTNRLLDDLWQSIASVWAAVLVRNLRFEPSTLSPSPGFNLLVLSHEYLRTKLIPWSRVYEAVESEWPQFGRLEWAYLRVVEEMMDHALSLDYSIHPVADVLWLCPDRYPATVVELVKAVHAKCGNGMVRTLGVDAYRWGTPPFSWPTVQGSLRSMLT